jgi:hypothetical protein
MASGRPLRVGALIQTTGAILIIKKDTAYASGFLAVLEVKIFIAPKLKGGVIIGGMKVTSCLEGTVEMHHILQEGIVGRQVNATPKPPD